MVLRVVVKIPCRDPVAASWEKRFSVITVRSVTPASLAIRPAFCGGMTLATAALWRPKSVMSVFDSSSTAVTLPPAESGTHSSKPG